MLSATCLCCAVQGLLLTVERSAPPTDPAVLTRALNDRIVQARQAHADLWAQIQSDECSPPKISVPAIFVLRESEARRSPQLAESAAQLNHAIDQIDWAIETWPKTCAGASPSPAVDYANEAARALDRAEAQLAP